MQLTARQLDDFERDGFLIFPDLFTGEEIRVLRNETDRLATIEADYVKRERTGALRTIFRVHGPADVAAQRAELDGSLFTRKNGYDGPGMGRGVDVV